MKTLNILRILLIIPILALSLAIAVPAHAMEPSFWEDSWDDTWDVENPCGFSIVAHEVATARNKVFFDNEGVPIRFIASYPNFKQTWSANGKSLNVKVSGPIHVEILSVGTDEILMMVGPLGLMTVPGYGNVQGFAGNFTFRFQVIDGEWEITEVYKVAGNLNPENNWDPICAYLGS